MQKKLKIKKNVMSMPRHRFCCVKGHRGQLRRIFILQGSNPIFFKRDKSKNIIYYRDKTLLTLSHIQLPQTNHSLPKKKLHMLVILHQAGSTTKHSPY